MNTKLRSGFLLSGIFIFGVLSLGVASVYTIRYFFPSVKDDSLLEEMVEVGIYHEFGFDIDLTPESKELINREFSYDPEEIKR